MRAADGGKEERVSDGKLIFDFVNRKVHHQWRIFLKQARLL
jgi:hypothetical protein